MKLRNDFLGLKPEVLTGSKFDLFYGLLRLCTVFCCSFIFWE